MVSGANGLRITIHPSKKCGSRQSHRDFDTDIYVIFYSVHDT